MLWSVKCLDFLLVAINVRVITCVKIFPLPLPVHTTVTEANRNSTTAAERKIRVLMVCIGNVCRSPMAEKVFEHVAKEKHLDHKFEVRGAGLIDFHVGERMDLRTIDVLHYNEIMTYEYYAARQITKEDFENYDYIFAVDKFVMGHLIKRAPLTTRARLEWFPAYDPENKDPKAIKHAFFDEDYEGFYNCFNVSVRASKGFLSKFEHFKKSNESKT